MSNRGLSRMGALLLAFHCWSAPLPVVLPEKIHSGELSISPDHGTVGEFGTWTLTYRVGAEPIKTGGGLRVELPKAWHTGLRSSAFRLQTSDHRADHYVSARCSNPAVVLQTIVEKEFDTPESWVMTLKPSTLTHSMGYYVYVARVTLLRGEAGSGDSLSVIYGDRSKGSPGMRAGVLAAPREPVTVAVDTEGLGRFRLHEQTPMLTLRPGLPSEMLLTAHSQVVTGEKNTLHIALLDEYQNAATGYSGSVELRAPGGRATVPSRVTVPPGRGWAEAPFTAGTPGIFRIEGIEVGRRIEARSNPVESLAKRPPYLIYWGDMHSHTRRSGADGSGREVDAYEYARRISGLEFYAMSDHSAGEELLNDFAQELWTPGWPAYRALVEKYDAPGEFATLLGYEISFDSPFGHHNVYFRHNQGPLPVISMDFTSLPEVWKMLRPGEALTTPHHAMKMPPVVEWGATDDPRFRRNLEIYSAHGLSEVYDPNHPLAFEQSPFTNPASTTRTGMSAQRAWEEGFELSTTASSDDHRAHPGQPQQVITAVRATALTREAIFDALYARRTYATTGVRIILDFDVNGVPMGNRLTWDGRSPLRLHARAIGTDVIDRVEVFRHCKGQPGFQTIYDILPGKEEVEFTFEDREVKGDAIYYLHLQQRHLVRGRLAMAWSSPVWIRRK